MFRNIRAFIQAIILHAWCQIIGHKYARTLVTVDCQFGRLYLYRCKRCQHRYVKEEQ